MRPLIKLKELFGKTQNNQVVVNGVLKTEQLRVSVLNSCSIDFYTKNEALCMEIRTLDIVKSFKTKATGRL